MRAIIFGGAKISDLSAIAKLLQPEDYIIAADAGARHCQKLGIVPNILLGDFDSIQPETLENLKAQGAQVQRFAAQKNETDLELALLHAKDQGADNILIFGGIGSRWDQSLASMLMLGNGLFDGLDILFWDRGQRLFLVKDHAKIEGVAGELVSLIPIGGHGVGVQTSGLMYPLNNEELLFGSTRGVSNVLLAEHAEVSVQDGLLLCVVGSKD